MKHRLDFYSALISCVVSFSLFIYCVILGFSVAHSFSLFVVLVPIMILTKSFLFFSLGNGVAFQFVSACIDFVLLYVFSNSIFLELAK